MYRGKFLKVNEQLKFSSMLLFVFINTSKKFQLKLTSTKCHAPCDPSITIHTLYFMMSLARDHIDLFINLELMQRKNNNQKHRRKKKYIEFCDWEQQHWLHWGSRESQRVTSYSQTQVAASHRLQRVTGCSESQVAASHKLQRVTSCSVSQVIVSHKLQRVTSCSESQVIVSHKLQWVTSCSESQVIVSHKL